MSKFVDRSLAYTLRISISVFFVAVVLCAVTPNDVHASGGCDPCLTGQETVCTWGCGKGVDCPEGDECGCVQCNTCCIA